MGTLRPPHRFTPEDVERASERDGRRYELIDGELKEKPSGTETLFMAGRICERLNSLYYPKTGFAVVQGMICCFGKRNHGRKPDVAFVRFDRLGDTIIPNGEYIRVAPDLAVEVLSARNSGIGVKERLDEYFEVGVAMVWIVDPDRRTIRDYRNNNTTRLFHTGDVIGNEPLLPGFVLKTGDVFPEGQPPEDRLLA